MKAQIKHLVLCMTLLGGTAGYGQYNHNVQLGSGNSITHHVADIDSISFTPAGAPTMHINLLDGNIESFGLELINMVTFQEIPPGSIAFLNCETAITPVNITQGIDAGGITATIPYTGGNGGIYSGQVILSTGITGLSATLQAGIFNSGAGTLNYIITGIPESSGTASFELNIVGQSCTLFIEVTAFTCGSSTVNFSYKGQTVTYGTVMSANRCWLDRNLGAALVAAYSSHEAAYGDLFQWGRGDDGHQNRTSSTTNILSSIDQPLHDSFILSPANNLYDWRSPQNNNLWQGVNGINNPCPAGFRIPTTAEWLHQAECWISNDSWGAINSPLKLPSAGLRFPDALDDVGLDGVYWSSTVLSTDAELFWFYWSAGESSSYRSAGLSVRCIQDESSKISSLYCDASSHTGFITTGMMATNASSTIPYNGGNGGVYLEQVVQSTGVSGLTATLQPGNFNNGQGALTYTITGTPMSIGIASFELKIGGQTCILTRTVSPFICGSSSVTFTYKDQVITYGTVISANRCWLDRNLGASQVATSIMDQSAYGDLFQWGRGDDGHQNRISPPTSILSSSDQPLHGNFIISSLIPFDWRTPQNNNLWQGMNSINNPCPSGFRVPAEVDWNTERQSWESNNSTSAFNSPLKLTTGGRRNNSSGSLNEVGSIGSYWSSTFLGTDARDFVFDSSNADMNDNSRAYGISVRCLSDEPAIQGSINTLDCEVATSTGFIIQGSVANGVSSVVPYSGGNGGTHNGQSVQSTGVTGLTAKLDPGNFVNGSDNLSYTITGTPSGGGTANFELNVGGQTCTLTREVSAFSCGSSSVTFTYKGQTETYGTVLSGNRCWLDRNLGASQVATSSADLDAYGDLFQWGRGDDGHQNRTSPTTSTLSSTDQPSHGNFILALNNPNDWRIPHNNNLWNGVNSINNPCPDGFRVPTSAEWESERENWGSNNAAGAFGSPLKLPVAGLRWFNSGLVDFGWSSSGQFHGIYWSSSARCTDAYRLDFNDNDSNLYGSNRANGYSVRCIKE